jgi:TPR repeat protein
MNSYKILSIVLYLFCIGSAIADFKSTFYSANQGDPYAQINLGRMYEKGEGVPQSYTEAVKWYRLAAEQGNGYAQNNLGMMYLEGTGVSQSYTESVKWFKLAAEQDLSKSQVNLGWYYMNGYKNLSEEAINYEQAVYWNQRAADNGNAEGYNNLGWLYENGLGVKLNLNKAAELYKNAVTKGIKDGNKKENIEEAKSRLSAVKIKIAGKSMRINSQKPDNDPLDIR